LYQKVCYVQSEEPPCPQNVRTGQPALTADVFYEQPLTSVTCEDISNMLYAAMKIQVGADLCF